MSASIWGATPRLRRKGGMCLGVSARAWAKRGGAAHNSAQHTPSGARFAARAQTRDERGASCTRDYYVLRENRAGRLYTISIRYLHRPPYVIFICK